MPEKHADKVAKRFQIPEANVCELSDSIVLVNSILTAMEVISQVTVPDILKEDSRNMIRAAFQHRVPDTEYSLGDMQRLERFRRELVSFVRANQTHPMIASSENQEMIGRFQNAVKISMPPEISASEAISL